MQTTKTVNPEKEAKRLAEQKAFDKDLKRANELMKAFAEFQKEKQETEAKQKEEIEAIKAKYADKISAADVPMKAAEQELVEIGERNKKRFEKSKLVLEDGYLLQSFTTVVKPGKTFEIISFMRKFPQLVSTTFNIKQMKDAFTDGDTLPKLKKFDIQLKQEESIKVKVNEA
jgi:Tfp pilus assembly major pilin PilA